MDDPKLIVSFHLMGQLSPVNSMLSNPMVNSLDVHFETSRNLLKTAQELNATEGYIFKNLEKDGKLFLEMDNTDLFVPIANCLPRVIWFWANLTFFVTQKLPVTPSK